MKALAISSSLEGLTKVISEYLGGSTITITKIDDNSWSVSNAVKTLDFWIVVFKKGRYRLEENKELK